MQLCALTGDDKLIFAHQAVKHYNYVCLECRQTVRLRSGIHRQAHFYHLQPNIACHQHSKGMIHLLLQQRLLDALPEGEAYLEYRFASIGRIADVAWLPRKIIFEIQYSPISPAEVMARNDSYASIGFQVVWILHDARYNRERLSAAEDLLQHHPHYFSDMDMEGQGHIYDHFSLNSKGVRLHRLPKLTIDPAFPRTCLEGDKLDRLEYQIPTALMERARRWPIGFSGDILERLDQDNEELMQALKKNSEPGTDFFSKPLWEALKDGWRRWVVLPYLAVLRLLIERACR